MSALAETAVHNDPDFGNTGEDLFEDRDEFGTRAADDESRAVGPLAAREAREADTVRDLDLRVGTVGPEIPLTSATNADLYFVC